MRIDYLGERGAIHEPGLGPLDLNKNAVAAGLSKRARCTVWKDMNACKSRRRYVWLKRFQLCVCRPFFPAAGYVWGRNLS